jgi:NAD(P)-dependent dehydrogenase (short-subunit alcohol dehydrogenase family)
MLSRDPDRGTAAADEVRGVSPNGAVHLIVGDISTTSGVRKVAAEVIAQHPGLSVLINNAGVSKFTREVTAEGLEATFATNHLAPFLLSNLLLDLLVQNAPAQAAPTWLSAVGAGSIEVRLVRGWRSPAGVGGCRGPGLGPGR